MHVCIEYTIILEVENSLWIYRSANPLGFYCCWKSCGYFLSLGRFINSSSVPLGTWLAMGYGKVGSEQDEVPGLLGSSLGLPSSKPGSFITGNIPFLLISPTQCRLS